MEPGFPRPLEPGLQQRRRYPERIFRFETAILLSDRHDRSWRRLRTSFGLIIAHLLARLVSRQVVPPFACLGPQIKLL